MKRWLLCASAASALLAFPAAAQVNAGASGPTTPAPSTASNPLHNDAASTADSTAGTTSSPKAKTHSAAASAADTSATAGSSYLKSGATVVDAAGAEVGRITKVTPGKAGAEGTVTLSQDGKTVTVPSSSLTFANGAVVSAHPKAHVWSAGETKTP